MVNILGNTFVNDISKTLDKINQINKIINFYNYTIYKYTGNYKGKIPNIENLENIQNKKYSSLNSYLNSKKIWKQIDNFNTFILDTNISIYNYIETIIKNWSYLQSISKIPNSRIIFSQKIFFMYDKIKNIESQKTLINKNKYIVKNINDDKLNPSMQSDINSLFRLKTLNSDLTFNEIITIFSGEFSDEFKEYIKTLDENKINKSTLLKKFNLKVK